MIAIIDYGMGNLRSVQNALLALGCENIITNDKTILSKADGWILPGVGAFPDCMQNLHLYQLVDFIKAGVQDGKPLLGICLGMQLLFEKSDEITVCEGLGVLPGHVSKMKDTSVKIPHIGWNTLEMTKEDPLVKNLVDPFVYYVHSFYVCDYQESDLLGFCQYGTMKVPGMFRRGNVCATQFHPEKSGEDGLQILKNYIDIVACEKK